MQYANTTDHSVLVDDEGHTIDGHTRMDLKDTPQVKMAVEQGLLVKVKAKRKSKADTDEGSKQDDADQGTIKKTAAKKTAKNEEGSKS